MAQLILSATGYSLSRMGGAFKYTVLPAATLELKWSKDNWQVHFGRNGSKLPQPQPGMAAITIHYHGTSPSSVREPAGSGYSAASPEGIMNTGYSLYVALSGTKTKDKYHVKFERVPEVVGPPGDTTLFNLDYNDPAHGVTGSATSGSTVTIQF